MIGAGNFAMNALLPAAASVDGIDLVGVVSASGVSARTAADRYRFSFCASDVTELLADSRINWICVATRHNLHSAQAIEAMRAGKDVFVEKPLALNAEQLAEIVAVAEETGRRIMVGFNRRFAPMLRELQTFFGHNHGPLTAVYRVNAGAIPSEHWTQDWLVGGGRIVGEGGHVVDALQFLVGSPPLSVSALAATTSGEVIPDQVSLQIEFADGSIGTIIYTSSGDRAFSKERLEIFGDGKVGVLDDFRVLELVHGGKRRRHTERLRPDKGLRAEWQAVADTARQGGPSPIPLNDLAATHLVTFAAVESISRKLPVPVVMGSREAD